MKGKRLLLIVALCLLILSLHHAEARYYDARVGRWLATDPLDRLAPGWSPYRYGFDNPLRNIDPAGRFEIDKATQKKYPALAAYLKNVSKEWKHKSEKFKSEFKEKSGLNDKQVSEMLKYGAGPKVEVGELDSKGHKANGATYAINLGNGKFANDNGGKGLIKLDNDVVDRFQDATSTAQRGTATVLLESTLFHEGTHVGNLKTSESPNGPYGESGKEFEKAVYGVDIGRENAASYYESNVEVQRMNPLPFHSGPP